MDQPPLVPDRPPLAGDVFAVELATLSPEEFCERWNIHPSA